MNAELFAGTIVELPQHSNLMDRTKEYYYKELVKYFDSGILHKIIQHSNSTDWILDKKRYFVECVSNYEYIAVSGTDSEVYEKMYELILLSIDNNVSCV